MIEAPATQKDCNYLMAELSSINKILAELPEDNIIETIGFEYRKQLITKLIDEYSKYPKRSKSSE